MQSRRADERYLALLTVLRDARAAAGLRQIDLAQRLQVPQSYVSKYETGERRLDLVELEDVAVALGMSVGQIVGLYEGASQR